MTSTTQPEMTTDEVRLYQDVDGVINAQMPYGWGKTQEGKATAEGRAYRIRWAPAMITELDALPVTRVWTTTWRDDAEHPETGIARLVGLPPGSRVLHPIGGELYWPSILWKYDAIVAEQAESPSRFVWLDDEVNEFIQERAANMGGYAPVINPLLGITPKIIESIKKYIDGADPKDLPQW
jgi:hypothetical protein